MRFILESQAKAEIRMQNFERRMEESDRRFESRMQKVEDPANAMEKRLDKRMDAIVAHAAGHANPRENRSEARRPGAGAGRTRLGAKGNRQDPESFNE